MFVQRNRVSATANGRSWQRTGSGFFSLHTQTHTHTQRHKQRPAFLFLLLSANGENGREMATRFRFSSEKSAGHFVFPFRLSITTSITINDPFLEKKKSGSRPTFVSFFLSLFLTFFRRLSPAGHWLRNEPTGRTS